MQRTKCIICDSSNLEEIIHLGSHSFADTFIPQNCLSEPDLVYPLICDLCLECGHIQTRCVTSPELRYAGRDYSYTSSNSAFSRNHWDEFAADISRSVELSNSSLIVEIGSNDGYLLNQFAKMGHRVVGVDPSSYVSSLAQESGIHTIVDFWSSKVSDAIIDQFGKADLIIANNVFNHSDCPVEFISAVKSTLSQNGKFIFEVPYWCIEFEKGRFDQIYHEHVSYFTMRSVLKLIESVGMYLCSVEIIDYHGGSLRVIVQNSSTKIDTSSMISKEISIKTYDPKSYVKLMNQILHNRNLFLQQIYTLKNNSKNIIAVGAAAKGNTLLTFYNLDHHLIDYVTDSSIHKQNKYTPKTRIPIVSDNIFADYKEVYAMILSWNISDRLKQSLYLINSSIIYLSL